MSEIIFQSRENNDHTRTVAVLAHRCAQSGDAFMFEFREWAVTDIAFEGGALVIRGNLIRSMRNHPMVRGATFSDDRP